MGVLFGSGDEIYDTSNYGPTAPHPMSVTFFFKPSNTSAGVRTIFSAVDALSGHYNAVQQSGTSCRIVKRGIQGPPRTRVATLSGVFTTGVWSRVSASWNTLNAMKLAVDGSNVSDTQTLTSQNNLTWMTIGGRMTASTPTFTEEMVGSLADVAIGFTGGILIPTYHDVLRYYEALMVQPNVWGAQFPFYNDLLDPSHRYNIRDARQWSVQGGAAWSTTDNPGYMRKAQWRRPLVPVFPAVSNVGEAMFSHF